MPSFSAVRSRNSVRDQNWVGPDGPFVREFEESIAKVTGRQWAVATITGSAALHLGVRVLGLGGVRYYINKNAFPALANVLVQENCTIHYQDNGFGHDFAAINLYKFPSLNDRAPAIGTLPEIKCTVECYSFAANKTITCGHGGAIVGDDLSVEEMIREESKQGYYRKGNLNYRMANINAAIGCAQIQKLDYFLQRKSDIWEYYAKHFDMIDRGPSRWMATTCTVPGLRNEEIVDQLELRYIEAFSTPFGAVSLPCSTGLTKSDQNRVIEALLDLMK